MMNTEDEILLESTLQCVYSDLNLITEKFKGSGDEVILLLCARLATEMLEQLSQIHKLLEMRGREKQNA